MRRMNGSLKTHGSASLSLPTKTSMRGIISVHPPDVRLSLDSVAKLFLVFVRRNKTGHSQISRWGVRDYRLVYTARHSLAGQQHGLLR
jgi:hypothetical protein